MVNSVELHKDEDGQISDDEQACYVYVPAGSSHEALPGSKKRRKISHAVAEIEGCDKQFFLPLLDGVEKDECLALRFRAYESAWEQQKCCLDVIIDTLFSVMSTGSAKTVQGALNGINEQASEEVVSFLSSRNLTENTNHIPTGLIVAGLSAKGSHSIYAAAVQHLKHVSGVATVSLAAAQCANLKSALKSIIQIATGQQDDGDDENGLRLLNYDLQILHDHVRKRSISRMILYFQNSEALDGAILAELIDVLVSWQERIPFILVFEIGTSVDLFQEKLSRSTLRHLRGSIFETKNVAETLELAFGAATDCHNPRSLFIGASLYKVFLDRQMENSQNPQAFVESLKYAHMTHYFVNALSCMLHPESLSLGLQVEHCEAIRNLPSFRRFVEGLLESKQLRKAQRLLDDEKFLEGTARELVNAGQRSLQHLTDALDVFNRIQFCIPTKSRIPWSKLYLKGLSGELTDSSIIKDMLLSVRKMPSDRMYAMLEQTSKTTILDLHDVQTDLGDLRRAMKPDQGPLRSEYDVHHETLRTTVVAQKVQLSKHKSTLSKQDAQYSKIVDRVDGALKGFFAKYLIQPKQLPLHEVFLFDLKVPVRDVFAPAPRQAVERALSTPHDYLDCDCCEGAESGLAPSHPATAILYQLYLESGAIINISDLWSAFNALLEPEDGDNEEGREQETLALFYRGLAELKYLGMLKNSRKKTDHLAKLLWKGL
ncbi:hypothetical protein MMC13_007599 [Lambiella insularis]|nr:hypothetical protein [Lambiella insularis]